MTRKSTVTVKQVFDAMKECDDNVKEASQKLKIKKSRIYNIKSQNKTEWAALETAHQEGENEVIKTQTIARHAEHKIPKTVKGVKSEMAEKHANVTRSIEGAKKVEPPKLKGAVPEEKKAPVVPGSKHPHDYEAENKRLRKANDDIAEALDRSNKEKKAVALEHNKLVDDYKEACGTADEKSREASKLSIELSEERKKHKVVEQENETLKAEIKRYQQDMHKERSADVIEMDHHVVKLGKMYVSETYELTDDIDRGKLLAPDKDAADIAERTGGTHYQVTLMEVQS